MRKCSISDSLSPTKPIVSTNVPIGNLSVVFHSLNEMTENVFFGDLGSTGI